MISIITWLQYNGSTLTIIRCKCLQVLEKDVASPAELAKAYMGSKPSKVSPSMFGLRSQTLRGDASLPNNVLFPPESEVVSLVQKPALSAGFT